VWPGSPDVAAMPLWAPFQLIVVEQSASSMEGKIEAKEQAEIGDAGEGFDDTSVLRGGITV
jgi:hypothetical protein